VCRSANVTWLVLVPLTTLPTAVHASRDVHEMAERVAAAAWLAVGWTVQTVPSHTSANGMAMEPSSGMK
jgi:hypothetical protein